MPSFRTRLVTCATLLCAASVAQAAPSSGGWDWMIAPYVWLPSISTDLQTTTPPITATGFSAFDDVLDRIDGAFLVHGEGQGDEFGVFADYIFFGLADDHQRPLFRTESDLDTRLFELAGVWSPNAERMRGFELFGGLRSIDLDLTFQVVPTNPALPRGSVHVSDTYNDFMLGGRYTFDMSDRWALTLRGDGSWGETDGTWNASAVAQYRTERGAWAFGWRYLNVDLASAGTSLDLGLSGPEVGYAFRF
jgi:hypothetical protein